ncbi:MAG TPA: hypothetical protein VI300_22115 [Solirubrobacter sp.]
MSRIQILLLALFAALLVAAPAQAASPVALGAGSAPWLVVDPAGTGHMVFRSTPDDGIVYCRLPRGKRACDVRVALPIGKHAETYKLLRRGDGVLIALQTDADEDGAPLSRQGGRLWASYSSDNGATFSPPAVLASGIDESFAGILSPDGQSVLLLQLQGNQALLRRAPFAGPDPRVLDIDDTGQTPSAAKLATFPDGRMLLIHSSLEDTTGWRVFNGGDPLDVNAWPTHGVLNGVRGAQLVTGPRGVFLLHRNGSNGQKLQDLPPASIRSFDTKRLRWRAARSALADQQIFAQSDLSEDASGRLHIVASNADYGGLGCVMYARTSTKSSSWFGRTTILYFTRSKSRMPSAATAVAAPDGRGFAAWTDASGRAWATPLKQAKGRYHPIRKGPNRPTCGR